MVKSLVGRVVLLAVVVALASTLVTAVVVVQAAGAQNAAQARATATREVESLAAVVESRSGAVVDVPDLPTVRALQRVLARRGAAAAVARPGNQFAVTPPFSSDDVAAVQQSGSLLVQRDVGNTTWAISGAQAGKAVALVAEPVVPARRLSSAQRRQIGLMIVLGLLGGALAGLLLARGVTRPLARVADAARRLTAGERDVRVPVEGPTEVGDVAVALDALSAALGRSESRQREFLLAVSHELRTPLTAVSG